MTADDAAGTPGGGQRPGLKDDGGAKIDTTGQLVDGTRLDGVASLREALLSRSDVFVGTMTQKLMIYGVGRPLQYTDMPAIRAIVSDAARHQYRFSSLITGIVNSPQFQMRTKSPGDRL